MPSTCETSVLTEFRTRTNNHRLRTAGRQALGVGVLVTIGAFLFFVIAWSQAMQFAVGTDIQDTDMARPGSAKQDRRARATGGAPLFLGYVEFDWDPERTNGTPGFGPAPRVLTADLAAANRSGE